MKKPIISHTREIARIWVRKVEPQSRIRLTADASENVPWLKAEPGFSISCIGRPGQHGQFVIVPEHHEEVFNGLKTVLSDSQPGLIEASSPLLLLARHFATRWDVVFTFEPPPANRFTFVLPKEARDLKFAPNENDDIVVFSIAELLEVWPSAGWIEHIGKIRSDLGNYREYSNNSGVF